MTLARLRPVVFRYGPLALCAAVLVWHSAQFGFVTDDAFISFVYSRNFAEHGELAFNLGDPVEGYTNFLWTVLLGVGMFLGLPPEPTSLVLGNAFAIGTLYVSFRVVELVTRRGSPWAYLPPALLALSSGFACWASGGLETQLFTFLVTAAIYCYVRGDARDPDGTPNADGRWLGRAGWLLALAAMTRPEGLIVAAVIGVHRIGFAVLRDRRAPFSPHELRAAASFLVLWAPWFAWRWWYYGYPFPNTYYVKAAGAAVKDYDSAMLANGLHYVWVWLTQVNVVWVSPLIAIGLAWARPRTPRFYLGSLLLPLAGIYVVYTITVGGDFMGLHRFVMPLFVIAAIGLALGLEKLASLIEHAAARRIAGPAVAAILVGLFAWDQLGLTRASMRFGNWKDDNGIDTPAFLWVYTHDRAVIGKRMAGCFTDEDFSIFGGAGAQPYYADMRGIDVFGLVSTRIAHEVPRTRKRAGHNKWGPDALLAEHGPDFVFSCYSIHRDPKKPSFNCDQRSRQFWLGKGFEQVTMHIPGLLQQGEYYTFFVDKDRHFECPGLIR
jgi:arabinofuranosyltransferase